MLNPAKASAKALLSAAQSHMDKGQLDTAELYIMQTLTKDATCAPAMAMMGELSVLRGAPNFAHFVMAIKTNPDELTYKERFIELSWTHRATRYDESMHFALLECLKSGDNLDCSRLYFFWYSILLYQPDFRRSCDVSALTPFDPANRAVFEGLSDFSGFLTPFFLLGLTYLVVPNPVFEELVVHLRRHLLADFGLEKKFSARDHVALSVVLAHYAFHTDYILDATAEEEEKVSALRARVEAGERTPGAVALLACYVPLYKLSCADALEESLSADAVLSTVIQEQISKHKALRAGAAAIKALTPISEGVSRAVQEQYEEFPYPRWRTMSKKNLARTWQERGGEGGISNALSRKKIKILNAGCGTGYEACALAVIYPAAEVLAVDLSRASLAYAEGMARKYDIGNITFGQADILRLRELDQQFDYIASSGVLHHMHDPLEGWKTLRDILKPGGIMAIGLYSKTARAGIARARQIIAEKDYAANAAGIRAFRRDCPRLVEPEAMRPFSSLPDYYTMNMCRDLLFHVQEHTFTLPEIEKCLDTLGLEFGGMRALSSVIREYGEVYPEDPRMMNLANWHEMETLNPLLFLGMYQFWCRKPV